MARERDEGGCELLSNNTRNALITFSDLGLIPTGWNSASERVREKKKDWSLSLPLHESLMGALCVYKNVHVAIFQFSSHTAAGAGGDRIVSIEHVLMNNYSYTHGHVMFTAALILPIHLPFDFFV